MTNYLKSFIFAVALVSCMFYVIPTQAHAGGVVSAVVNVVAAVVAPVVNTVVQAVNNVVNVVVGVVETTVGVVADTIGTAASAIGISAGKDLSQWSQGLKTDGQNRVIAGFSGAGEIRGADPYNCYTNNTATYIGGPAVSWSVSGGPAGVDYKITSEEYSQSGHKVSLRDTFTFTPVNYTVPGNKFAYVDASYVNRSDGRFSCSGFIRVFANATQYQEFMDTGKLPGDALDNPVSPYEGLPGSLEPGGEGFANEIRVTSACTPTQTGRTGIFVNREMVWTVSIPSEPAAPTNLTTTWEGTNVASTEGGLTLNKIYTTIGPKTITARTTGTYSDGKAYIAECMASTTVRFDGGTYTEF